MKYINITIPLEIFTRCSICNQTKTGKQRVRNKSPEVWCELKNISSEIVADYYAPSSRIYAELNCPKGHYFECEVTFHME